MEFLAVILKSPRHRVLFEKEGVLPTIATNVVLPNLTLRGIPNLVFENFKLLQKPTLT